MSVAARTIGRALAPIFRSVRSLLGRQAAADGDRSSRFRTESEQGAWLEVMESRRATAERVASLEAAQRVLLRRADAHDAAARGKVQASGASGKIDTASSTGTTDNTIAGIDATSFFIIWGIAATIPVLLYAALCKWAEVRAREAGGSAAGGDARLTNRKVLDARIEAIEQHLATEAAAARGSGTSSSTAAASTSGSVAPAAAVAAAEVFESSFLAGVAGELARRRDAMLKPPPLIASPPSADVLARLEARLADVEKALASAQSNAATSPAPMPPT